jgi:hypothetical protein
MQLLSGSGYVQSPLPDSGRTPSYPTGSRPFRPNPAGSIQIRLNQWPDSDHFGRIWPASSQIRPESGLPASGNGGRVSSDVAEFRCRLDSDDRPLLDFGYWISNVHVNDKEFNFGKWFTIFKTVNCFPKIKEGFTVKPKMIFVDH